MSETTVGIKIVGDSASAQTALKKIGDAMQGLASSSASTNGALASTGASLTKLFGAVAGASAVALVFAGLKSAVFDFNGQMEQSKIAWTTMLKSADAASVVLKDLQSFAARTPFEFPGLERSAKRLVAMGFAAKDIIPIMTDVGNASAALGGGQEGVDRIVTALGQMQAKGKVSAEEMNQLAEMGVPAWQMLANATGKPIPQLMKLAEQGDITAAQMISAFRRYSQENWGGMMDKQSRTFLGVLSTIKDTVTQTVAGAFEPLFNRVSALALKIADFVSSADFARWGAQVRAAVNGVLTLLDRAGEAAGSLAGSWGGAWASVQDTVAAVLPVVADFAIGVIAGLVTWWDETIPKLAEIVEAVLGFIQQIWQTYGENIVNLAVLIWQGIAGIVESGMSIVSDVIGAVLAAIKGDWAGALNYMNSAISTAWGAIVDNLALGAKALANIIGAVFKVFGQTAAVGDWTATIDAAAASAKNLGAGVAYASEETTRAAEREGIHASAAQRNRIAVEGLAKSILGSLVPAKKTDMQAHMQSEHAYNNAQAALDRQAAAANNTGGAVADAGKKAKEAGISVGDLTKALVAQHPATLAAAAAVKFWESRIADVNLAVEANQDQLKAAQDELRGMQDRLGSLNDQLSVAKQRFDDLSRPRLTGMGEAEDQLFALEQQLKRVQYATLTGLSLGSVKGMFPALTAGQEAFLSTLPETEDGLQKVQQQLQLAQSLNFDGQLRQIEQAAAGAQKELGFADAMSQMLGAKAQVEGLTGAVQAQEAAIKGQEAVVRSIQAAQDGLNQTLRGYQEQLTLAKLNQDAVNQSLAAAFTWILSDREEIEKMGPAGVAAAKQVDAATVKLLKGLSAFAEENTATNQLQVSAMNDAYTIAVEQIKGSLASIPKDFDVTVHVKQVVDGAFDGKRAAGGPVTAGRAYLVGENGPEPFIPSTSGFILPNSSLSGGGVAGGGGNVYITVQGSVISERQLVDVVTAAQREYARDNGGRLY